MLARGSKLFGVFRGSKVKILLIFKWLWFHVDEYGKLYNSINNYAVSTGLMLSDIDWIWLQFC